MLPINGLSQSGLGVVLGKRCCCLPNRVNGIQGLLKDSEERKKRRLLALLWNSTKPA